MNSPGESLWSVNVTPFSHRVVKPPYISRKNPSYSGRLIPVPLRCPKSLRTDLNQDTPLPGPAGRPAKRNPREGGGLPGVRLQLKCA
ncbi:hypothetical protein D187_007166 [Cystobacter fuscus DSM 2262]|uniref:Uncharacterized protein n=1 Tax=Cystobacter fuscus (strain ATCC 25194 / DSM 2262 / NBRC 100088 / M29) TaxID=1242864 RepID=S9P5B1_CYSF2|nr:hypothetical protein D187_007166 [Cystobacter fuscus DSM 2262]